MRSAIAATVSVYIVNNGVGLAIAVADDLGASPLGISTGMDPEVDFFFLGTALCAPLVLLVVVVVLVALIFGDRAELALRGLIVCGIFFAAGMLAEPITYRVLSPGGFEWPHAVVVVANIVVPSTMAALSLSELARRRSKALD